jgi:hypothetical protein
MLFLWPVSEGLFVMLVAWTMDSGIGYRGVGKLVGRCNLEEWLQLSAR